MEGVRPRTPPAANQALTMKSIFYNLHWLWLSLLIVIADQVTKWLAEYSLDLHAPVPILPGFNLTLVYNPGAAFSFLSQAGGWQRWFFVFFALAISCFLIFWLLRLPARAKWLACSLALIIGGAIGNLVDRLAYGHVIDFIDLYYGSWHWPAFNIADAAITVGAVMLIIDAFWLEGRRQRREGG